MRGKQHKSTGRIKRILLVENEAGFRNILKVRLPGYDVCVANNPLKTIEIAHRFKPDIMFLDAIMTDADGNTVAGQVRADPELNRIPIVLLTTAPQQNVGAYDCLTKPVQSDTIIACVKKHLGRSLNR